MALRSILGAEVFQHWHISYYRGPSVLWIRSYLTPSQRLKSAQAFPLSLQTSAHFKRGAHTQR